MIVAAATHLPTPFSVVLTVGAIAAVLLAVILIATRSTAGRILGALGVVVALLAGVFFVKTSATIEIHNRGPAELEFHPTEDMLADADPQPSVERAARALARRVVRQWPVGVTDAQPVRRITLGGTAPAQLLNDLSRELSTHYPGARIERTDQTIPLEPDDLIALTLDATPAPGGKSGDSKLHLTIRRRDHVHTDDLSLVNKPWFADPASHLARYPDGAVAIAHSREPGSSATDALHQAYEQAAAEAWGPIRTRVEQRVGRMKEEDAMRLRARLPEAIRLGHITGTDQYVQEIGRDYGWIWRASVLVPLDDSSLRPVVMDFAGTVQQQRRSSLAGLLSMGGLLLVILLLYFFLNTATKGYFQFSLRAAALLVLTAGVLVIMMIA